MGSKNYEKQEDPCLDTIMERFCGVRPISLAAVLVVGHVTAVTYMMTTITTVYGGTRVLPKITALCGPASQKRLQSIRGGVRPLTLTTDYTPNNGIRLCHNKIYIPETIIARRFAAYAGFIIS